MEEEKRIAKKRKLNMKLYPTYRMLAADVLFYNAIKVLFLTQVKGFSNAEVVFAESIYAFFKMVMQISIAVIVSKLGIRKSVIVGNIFWIFEMVFILLAQNYFMLILAQFSSAIGWGFKSVAEVPLLNKSIPEVHNKGKIFTKLDSKGYSRYCYISAISTVIAGFLYEVNPYIPVILAITFMVMAFIISLNFIEVKKEESKTVKESINDVKEGLKFIVRSPRLKSLLLMIGFMWGIICLFGTYQTTLLKDINVSAKYIGIILAVLDIIQGISATRADKFNEQYKNKTLTHMTLQMTLGIMLAGVVVIIGLTRIPMLAIIIFTYIIRVYDKGVYKIIKRRYIGNFMTPEILSKVYSVDSIIASILRMSICAFGSYLLTLMPIQYAMIVAGILFTIVALVFSKYMKTRVGLKPKDYTKKDVVCIH